MAKPVTRIWCPKCHKRHKLPPNAGGLTLRCRKCRFAFPVQDGLTQDPAEFSVVAPAQTKPVETQPVETQPIETPAEQPAHYTSQEAVPVGDAASQSSSVDLAATVGAESVIPVGGSDAAPAFSFDDDYDDILEVLDKPASAPLPVSPLPPSPLPVGSAAVGSASSPSAEEEDLPPPRAHASKGRSSQGRSSRGQSSQSQSSQAASPANTRAVSVGSTTPTRASSEESVRTPVTREQLRSHRNTRQFWMLVTFLFACFLGIASWFGLRLFLQPGLSDWERKLLYAMGTPARLLPPQDDQAEPLLPPNRVKLRGDHAELADRNDAFREDFFEDDDGEGLAGDDSEKPRNFGDRRRAVEDADPNGEDADRQRDRQARNNRGDRVFQVPREQNGDGPQVQNVPKGNAQRQAQQAARVAPRQNVQRQNRQPQRPFHLGETETGNVDGMGALSAPSAIGGEPDDRRFVRRNNRAFVPQPRQPGANRQPRNPRRRTSNFQPPTLLNSDVQIVSGLGIDPKSLRSLSFDVGTPAKVAIVDDVVFSIGSNNRLAAFDVSNSAKLDDQRLDRDVAAICNAAKDGISNRPAAWVLFKSGKLEKWEVRDASLVRQVSLSVNPVFKERYAVVATANGKVAYAHEGKVVISDVLEASGKVGFTIRVPVDGDVRSLRFSADESMLLALVDDKAVRIPVRDGEVESAVAVSGLKKHLAGLEVSAVSISSDLKNIFVCTDRFVSSFRVADGFENGRYWPSLPVSFDSVVSDGDRLLGIATASRYATLFAIEEIEPVDAGGKGAARNAGANRDQAQLLANGDDAALAGGNSPHELSRSPILAAPIQSLQTLAQDRIAFLTQEDSNRIAIATWKNGWSVKSLKLAAGFSIDGFSMSDDLSKVAIWSDDVIQAWRIDPNSAQAEFVSECVAHTENIATVSLTNDGERIISGSSSGNVIVSSFDTGKTTGGVSGFRTSITDIALKGDEGFVVMDQQGIAKGSGNSSRDKIVPFGRNIRSASSLSSGGTKIAWFQDPSTVNIADVSNQKVLHSFSANDRPDFIRFSEDQKYLLLQTGKEIAVWDWRRSERVRVFRYSKNVGSGSIKLDVSNDGKSVVVVSGENLNQIAIYEMPN